MVEDVGERDHVPVFSRYAEMKRLAATPGVGLAAWLSPDGLHMNDLGYACVANGLARMIEDAAKVTTAMRERGADPKAPGPAPAEDRRAFQTRAAHGPH
jgi:hypothetical protein